MGLTTWKNAPDGKIIKTDVSIAKNYLTRKELKSLDRIVQDRLFESDFDKMIKKIESPDD
jgi:hypothetical protein